MSKIVWCDPGWFPIRYGFCPDRRAWAKMVKEFDDTGRSYPDTSGRVTVYTRGDDRACVVTINAKRKRHTSLQIIGLIVHEAAHVWQEVLDNMGEKVPSPEFEAYALQGISMELINAFSETRWKLTP